MFDMPLIFPDKGNNERCIFMFYYLLFSKLSKARRITQDMGDVGGWDEKEKCE